MPDGLTVDAAGDLWVAIWGGGASVATPRTGRSGRSFASRPSRRRAAASPDSGLHRLYVTTATENWTTSDDGRSPEAGLVYRFETDATGLPSAPFRPDPAWWAAVMAA